MPSHQLVMAILDSMWNEDDFLKRQFEATAYPRGWTGPYKSYLARNYGDKIGVRLDDSAPKKAFIESYFPMMYRALEKAEDQGLLKSAR